MSTHRLYVSMDSIMDTMFACVQKEKPEWGLQLLLKNYHRRISNNFSYILPEIDNSKIKENWKNRDTSILKKSKPTFFLNNYSLARADIDTRDKSQPDYLDISVSLNVFPYRINTKERDDFKEVISGYFRTDDVNIIYYPIQQMHPHWIKTNFDQVILYDINEWLGCHIEALKNYRLKNVIFTFPLILLDEIHPAGKDPRAIVDSLKMSFIDIIQPDIIPLEEMSCYIPPNPEKEVNKVDVPKE